jgi:peroxiredoxin
MPARRLATPFLAASLLLLLAPPHALRAQETQESAGTEANTFGHSRHGEVFDEGPRQAAYRMAGLGSSVHFPVAGLGEEAQAFFDQGITQQHGFWYFEAERSFRQVAMLHPDCAMAYAGMALANVENRARASGFAARAVEKAADATPRERMWIDAIAAYHRIDDALRTELQSGDAKRVETARKTVAERNAKRDEKQLGRDFVRGLEAIVAAHPDDIEAKAFLAVQCWRNVEFGLPITSHGAVDALLDQVFAAAPDHPAHHYRIHLWDGEKHERAIRSAAANGASAPGIAHQWHMSGHVYAGLNRHAEALWQQEASARVDHDHMLRDRVMPYEIHNYGHNQEWLVRSYGYVGRVRDAVDLAKNMIELPRHKVRNRLGDRRHVAGYGRARLLELIDEHELWDVADAAHRDGYLDPVDDVVPEAQRLEVLGRAFHRSGQSDRAAAIHAQAEALLARARKLRADAVDAAETAALDKQESSERIRAAMDDAGRKATDPVRAVHDVLRMLQCEKLLAAGDAKAAVAALGDKHGLSKAQHARLLAAAGDHPKAIEVVAEERKARPNRVTSTATAVAVLHAAGRVDEARVAFDELRRLAGRADLDQPLLHALAPIAAEFGYPVDWRTPVEFGDDFGARPELASLGPVRWHPTEAPGFDLAVAGGGRMSLTQRAGRPTLVVFYLGFGCLQCVEQLQSFVPLRTAFADAGIDIVAIGTDDADSAAASLAAMPDADRIPFPLLADPELTAFRAWRCHDDFEQMPLHGTFLVDGEGRVRWQEISFEPTKDVDWLLNECRRLLRLPAMQ